MSSGRGEPPFATAILGAALADSTAVGLPSDLRWVTGLLAHALRSISECVSITDTADRILFVNDAFLRTYGYEEDELLGQHISIVRAQKNAAERVREILPASFPSRCPPRWCATRRASR
jgi:PAS domain-containing protein